MMPPFQFPKSAMSNARMVTSVAALAALAFVAAPAAAQDQAKRQDAIDLTELVPPLEPDEFAIEQCERDADAAKIAGEIVVCRTLTEGTDGFWNKEAWERRYAEETQGRQPVDVDGTGLPNGMVPLVTIRACFIPPCPTEPAILIDVGALPDPPAGSDADRIAHGLPPLGDDGDNGRGPANQAELGLPPAPIGTP